MKKSYKMFGGAGAGAGAAAPPPIFGGIMPAHNHINVNNVPLVAPVAALPAAAPGAPVAPAALAGVIVDISTLVPGVMDPITNDVIHPANAVYIDTLFPRRAFDINSINGILNVSVGTGPNNYPPFTYGIHPYDGTPFTIADIVPVGPEMIDLLNDFTNNHTYNALTLEWIRNGGADPTWPTANYTARHPHFGHLAGGKISKRKKSKRNKSKRKYNKKNRSTKNKFINYFRNPKNKYS
jgi:hypothetical protein